MNLEQTEFIYILSTSGLHLPPRQLWQAVAHQSHWLAPPREHQPGWEAAGHPPAWAGQMTTGSTATCKMGMDDGTRGQMVYTRGWWTWTRWRTSARRWTGRPCPTHSRLELCPLAPGSCQARWRGCSLWPWWRDSSRGPGLSPDCQQWIILWSDHPQILSMLNKPTVQTGEGYEGNF